MSGNDDMGTNQDIKVYQDKKAKAEDFKSSAYTLLLVGIIGIAALILMEAGLLPFRLVGSGRYMTYGVMGTLFIIFIVMGIFSLRSSKQYAKEATQEEDQTSKIKAWTKEHLTAEFVKEQVWFEDDTPDEMKYFKYFEYIKTAVVREFGDLNASYLEALCEELYAEIFENE
ncbi:MAG: hypothetical protein J6C19_04030 [Lachnospiraceae bacterium]|nr:hypothetical protein [Lachnospiraceae bacterium]